MTVNAVADDAVEIAPKQGEPVRVEFDPATGLPARYKYQSMGMQGPSSVVSSLSDWREVSGFGSHTSSSLSRAAKSSPKLPFPNGS